MLGRQDFHVERLMFFAPCFHSPACSEHDACGARSFALKNISPVRVGVKICGSVASLDFAPRRNWSAGESIEDRLCTLRMRERSARRRESEGEATAVSGGRSRRRWRPIARPSAKARIRRSSKSPQWTKGEPRGCPRNGQSGEQTKPSPTAANGREPEAERERRRAERGSWSWKNCPASAGLVYSDCECEKA